MQYLTDNNLLKINSNIQSIVFPDKFIDHATPDAMYKSANMDALSIVKRVIKLI